MLLLITVSAAKFIYCFFAPVVNFKKSITPKPLPFKETDKFLYVT